MRHKTSKNQRTEYIKVVNHNKNTILMNIRRLGSSSVNVNAITCTHREEASERERKRVSGCSRVLEVAHHPDAHVVQRRLDRDSDTTFGLDHQRQDGSTVDGARPGAQQDNC